MIFIPCVRLKEILIVPLLEVALAQQVIRGATIAKGASLSRTLLGPVVDQIGTWLSEYRHVGVVLLG